MAQLIVPRVCRFVVRGTWQGRPWANIWDVDIPTDAPARNTSIPKKAAQILDAYCGNFLTTAHSTLSVDSVYFVDLDSATGLTGSITSSTTNTLPKTGFGSGESVPPNVAVLVTKAIPHGRNARNGRVYVAGLTEANSAGAALAAGVAANYQTNMNAVLTACNATVDGFSCTGVVVSRPRNAAASSHAISSLSASSKPATIRRRLRP
jgi:hypothetical protein